ncbi:MAG: hypothetical protein V4649_09915 [Bacteroidota bacterium]
MDFLVKNIVEQCRKRGDLAFANRIFTLRKFLFTDNLCLADLAGVEAFEETTLGLESACCVDFIFKNDDKLLFNAYNPMHQEFVNIILHDQLNCEPIKWSEYPLCPFSFEKEILFAGD